MVPPGTIRATRAGPTIAVDVPIGVIPKGREDAQTRSIAPQNMIARPIQGGRVAIVKSSVIMQGSWPRVTSPGRGVSWSWRLLVVASRYDQETLLHSLSIIPPTIGSCAA